MAAKQPKSSEQGKKQRRRAPGNPDKIKPYQFKPGQSGNPGGRPKKRPITEMYERLLNDPKFIAGLEVSVRKMVASGRMVGQLQLKEMAERVEGKVAQPLKHEGEVTHNHTELPDDDLKHRIAELERELGLSGSTREARGTKALTQ